MKPRSLSLTAIHALRLLAGSWRDGRQRLALTDEGPDGEGHYLIYFSMPYRGRDFFTVPPAVFTVLKQERYVAVEQVGAWQSGETPAFRQVSYRITEAGQRALAVAIAPQKLQ